LRGVSGNTCHSFINENGILEITGTSTPEDSFTYYKKPIFQLAAWIGIALHLQKLQSLILNFDYFNTSSSKCVVNILKSGKIFHEGHEVEISWYYPPR